MQQGVGSAVRFITLLLTLICGLACSQESPDYVLVGTVQRIVDGDTLDVLLDSGTIRVRMHGIDTPERGQAYFNEASDELHKIVSSKPVELSVITQDRYDRLVATVYAGDLDVNGEMIRRGMAYAERRYLGQIPDGEGYCRLEHEARIAKRGIWNLPQEQRIPPWEYRQRKNRTSFTNYANETLASCIAAIGKPLTSP